MKLLKISAFLASAAFLANAAFAQLVTPQGRLSLSSTQAVMTSDVTGTNTIYYVAYAGTLVPGIINGTWYNQQSASLPLTLTLNSSVQTTGQVRDIYMFENTVTAAEMLGIGPAWYNPSIQRCSGSCSTNISQDAIQGFWVNTNAITLHNGTYSYSIPAGYATYLGSVYMTGNGETSVNIKPAAAANGSANVIGIWNAYNRVPIYSLNRDSNNQWSQTSSTGWQAVDPTSANSVTWVDGLGQTSVLAQYLALPDSITAGLAAHIGINEDSTTATPNLDANEYFGVTSNYITLNVEESFPPLLGMHYVQAMEEVGGASGTVYWLGTYPYNYEGLTLKSEY
jgi:hypothetical protein